MGGKAKKKNQFETVLTYDDWEDIKESMDSRNRRKAMRDRENRAKYYNRQRVLGLAILTVGAAFLIVGCMILQNVMQYFGAVVGFVGLYVMFTRHMVLVDKYYMEVQDRIHGY